MAREELNLDMPVDFVIEHWPETIPVFNKHRMGCVGCSMSAFETLGSAAEIYHLPLQRFLDELQQTIQK